MVSIIKNQLLKHLSRFTKNLSADKINLSTFKGEGEFSNLELNEIVLTDLLELPSWLRITKASCNRVSFKINWRKLKSVPMLLYLDEVNVWVETCEDLRPINGTATFGLPADLASGEYSYIHKIIDGISVSVNLVNVKFQSAAFTASVEISRINVVSTTYKWVRCSDLKATRIKNASKGQLLLFKELEWQSLRIEAKSIVDANLAPLRLLTNQARCRIVIKKRLKDCFVMGSKLAIILDDVLWVLTDSQLKAALHFLDSLAGLVQKATQMTRKVKAARKLADLPVTEPTTPSSSQASGNAKTSTSATHTLFDINDVVETSYHFITNSVVLHLCDDEGIGRSSSPSLKDGASLQIGVKGFQVDFYPYHLARGSRRHWPKYDEGAVPHAQWQRSALQDFRNRLLQVFDQASRRPSSSSNSRTQQMSEVPTTPSSPGERDVRKQVERQLAKVMSMCVVLRVEDFTMYSVTTCRKKQLKEFISGNADCMSLPKNSNVIHAEFIYYYYPSEQPFPLPPPKFYVHVNPIQVAFDVDSCLWLNAFILNLYQSLIASKQSDVGIDVQNYTYVDVKIEAILPKLQFDSERTTHDSSTQRDRPKQLQFQVTRLTLSNIRSLDSCSRADLAKCVDMFQMGSLFSGIQFPSQPGDFTLITQKFIDHISMADNVRQLNTHPKDGGVPIEELFVKELLWLEAKDIWCLNLEPVWGDFLGARAVGANKPVPFLDVIPVTIWLHSHMDPNSTIKVHKSLVNADVHALVHISNLASIQVNHYQYLFLLRLAEQISELMVFLSIDSSKILKVDSTGSIVIGAILPQIEVTFVMPAQSPGKDLSGCGDPESFVPDTTTSSTMDDGVGMSTGGGAIGSAATVWQQNASSSLSINNKGISGPQKSPVKRKEIIDVSATPTTLPCTLMRSYSTNEIKPTSESNITEHSDITNHGEPSNLLAQQSDNVGAAVNNNKPNLQTNINASFSSMKKGFSNFMSSLEGSSKRTTTSNAHDDASNDSISIRSDGSSDSDNVVSLIGDNSGINGGSGILLYEGDSCQSVLDLMFVVREFHGWEDLAAEAVEMASEVLEDGASVMTTTASSSDAHHSNSSTKRKDLISLSTFKLSKVEFFQQSRGYSSTIKVQVGNLDCEECASIPWDEFQGKFVSRSRAWSSESEMRIDDVDTCGSGSSGSIYASSKNAVSRTAPNTRSRKSTCDSGSVAESKIKLRLNHVLVLPSNVSSITEIDVRDTCVLSKLFKDDIVLSVCDLSLDLTMSTLTGLVDVIEDEIIQIPIPLKMHISNVNLHLIEDRPPVNITSPGPVPIFLNVAQLFVTRTEDGCFHVSHMELNQGHEQSNDQLVEKLQLELDTLRRRLAPFERVSEENRSLRYAHEENQVLKACLTAAQDENARLLDEKQRLLDELRCKRNFGQSDGNSGAATAASSSSSSHGSRGWIPHKR